MKTPSYLRIIAAALCVSVIGAGIFYINGRSIYIVENPVSNISINSHTSNSHARDTTVPDDQIRFINTMVKRLIEQHSHEIHQISVQMQMQDFRNFITEQYPSNHNVLFTSIMQQAFPRYADDIFSLIDQLDEYHTWYADNLLDLNDLDQLTRSGTLWEQRRLIFGDLAQEIWQKEIESEEYKRQTMQQTLTTLNNADDISLDEQLYVLTNTLNTLYPEEDDHFKLNKNVISGVYFQLDSVQKNLANMAPQERQDAITKSRKELGYSDDDITYLTKEDALKEARWQNGYAYMSARDQLTQNYSGETLETQLVILRESFFSHEAPTIAAEENAGFYRYNRPRLFGSN